MFSHLNDILNFTIQANIKIDFPLQIVEEFIKKMQLAHVNSILDRKKDRLLKNLMKVVDGKELLNLNQEDIETLTRNLNCDLQLKLSFIEEIVLPEVGVYQRKTKSTAFSLVRPLQLVQGASGTINPDTLPSKIEVKESRSAIIHNLLALWKKTADPLIMMPSDSLVQLKSLFEKEPTARCLIDIAGTFRYLSTMQIAQSILEKIPAIKGVLLFDAAGRELILERDRTQMIPSETSTLAKEELFYYICKNKAIGTDLRMPACLQGIATYDRDTLKDFFLQGLGRLRGLANGQNVVVALSSEDEQFIKKDLGVVDPLKFKDLFLYATRIQGRAKGEDNLYALRLCLEDLVEGVCWEAFEKASHKNRMAFYNILEPFFSPSFREPAYEAHKMERKELPIKEAVERLQEELLAFAKKHPTLFDLENLKKQFSDYVDFDKLPKSVRLLSHDEITSEVNVEFEENKIELAEKMVEIDMENDENSGSVPSLSFTPVPPKPWDGELPLFSKKSDFFLFGIEGYYSPNALVVSQNPVINAQVRKPAYQTLFLYNRITQVKKLVVMDLHDAKVILNRMSRDALPLAIKAYLISSQEVIASTPGDVPSLFTGTFLTPQLSLLLKCLTGSTRLTKEEKLALENGLKDEPNLKPFLQALITAWPHMEPLLQRDNL